MMDFCLFFQGMSSEFAWIPEIPYTMHPLKKSPNVRAIPVWLLCSLLWLHGLHSSLAMRCLELLYGRERGRALINFRVWPFTCMICTFCRPTLRAISAELQKHLVRCDWLREFLSSPDFAEISGIRWNLGEFGETRDISGKLRGTQWNSVGFCMALSMNSVGFPGGFRGSSGFSGKFGVWGGFGWFAGSKGFCGKHLVRWPILGRSTWTSFGHQQPINRQFTAINRQLADNFTEINRQYQTTNRN